MSRALRIVHLDGSAAVTERIVAKLEQAGVKAIIERVETQEGFSATLRNFSPDIVLCDHAEDRFDTRAALHLLQLHHPAVPLIVVASGLDEHTAVSILRAGAENIVSKDRLERLSEAIESALAVRRRLKKLTPRQLEVLQLVAVGHTTREIARRLKLSAKTVESHRGEVMKRLGIHDVVGLVRYAVRVGMVPSDYRPNPGE